MSQNAESCMALGVPRRKIGPVNSWTSAWDRAFMRIYDTVVLAPVNRMPGVKFVHVSPAVAQIECGRATALGTRWRMSDWAGRCLEETVNRHSIRVHVGNGTAHWTGAGCRDPDHARVVTDVS